MPIFVTVIEATRFPIYAASTAAIRAEGTKRSDEACSHTVSRTHRVNFAINRNAGDMRQGIVMADKDTVFAKCDIYRLLRLLCKLNRTPFCRVTVDGFAMPIWGNCTFGFKPVRFSDYVSVSADAGAGIREKDLFQETLMQAHTRFPGHGW